MKRIRTKLIVAMTALTVFVLAITEAAIIITQAADYRNDFYTNTEKFLQNKQLLSCKTETELCDFLDKNWQEHSQYQNYVVFKNSTAIFGSGMGGAIILSANLQKLLSGKPPVRSTNIVGTLDYGTTLNSGFTVYIIDTQKELYQKIGDLSFKLVQAAVLGFLLTVIISWFLSKKLTKPIATLKQGAEKMAQGEFCPVDITSNDEIGSLCRVFNTMGEQISKTYESFERQEQIRSEFVANVSHELKTPLTVIKSYSETLAQMPLDDKTRAKFLNIIDAEVDRVSDIVSQLLEISEMEHKSTTAPKTQVNIFKLCNDILTTLDLQTKNKNLSVNVCGEGTVLTNADMAHTIVLNLLTNAVKYTNEHGVISVLVSGNCLYIKNSGEGISKSDLEHIFERFYRADKAHSRGGGTGLGLSIASLCASAIGAKIKATSIIGELTEFSVEF